MVKRPITVLFSGGLDSTYLLWSLALSGHIVRPVFFRKQNSVYADDDSSIAQNSLDLVNSLLRRRHKIKLTEFAYTPILLKGGQEVGRHLMFVGGLIEHLVTTKSKALALGVYPDAGDGFPDARRPFIDALDALFAASDVRVNVLTMPLPNKAAVLRMLRKEGAFDAFVRTTEWCFNRVMRAMHSTGAKGCGTCMSCKVMLKALEEVC